MKPDMWLSKVLRDDTLTTTQRAVAAALWSYMDRAGVCWPSVETIGQRAGISKRRNVRLALDMLTERGHLERVLQPNGRLSTNRYKAVDKPPRGVPKGTATVVPLGTHRGAPKGTPQGGPPRGPRTSPEELVGEQPSAPTDSPHPYIQHLANHWPRP